MWFERFVIIVVGLHRAFLPSGWGMFYPTRYDIGILIGSFGLFFTLFLLFIRSLPMIAMWEIKDVTASSAHIAKIIEMTKHDPPQKDSEVAMNA
jgi:molybdopterin-containing oxidoreductase family membrane subunit